LGPESVEQRKVNAGGIGGVQPIQEEVFGGGRRQWADRFSVTISFSGSCRTEFVAMVGPESALCQHVLLDADTYFPVKTR
jgi:hypothetical protein